MRQIPLEICSVAQISPLSSNAKFYFLLDFFIFSMEREDQQIEDDHQQPALSSSPSINNSAQQLLENEKYARYEDAETLRNNLPRPKVTQLDLSYCKGLNDQGKFGHVYIIICDRIHPILWTALPGSKTHWVFDPGRTVQRIGFFWIFGNI